LTSALQFGHYDVAKYLIASGVSLQSAKDMKIKLLRGEEPGSETDAQTVLKNSIQVFESMSKPKIVKQRPVELNILAPLAPHFDEQLTQIPMIMCQLRTPNQTARYSHHHLLQI